MQKNWPAPCCLLLILIHIFLFTPAGQAAVETSPAPEPEEGLTMKENPLDSVISGNTEFALALYQEMSESEDNLFFSPYSISTALAMTYAGAGGSTEKQMAQTLRFSLSQDVLHKTMNQLNQALNRIQDKAGVTLNIANSLWIQQHFRLLKSFLERMETSYNAPPNRVDFIKSPKEACETVNAWVSEKTQNKITELLPPKAVTPMTRMVLTNAIYFLGKWALSFDPKKTQDAPFYLDRQATVTTPFMFRSDRFLYAEDDEVQVLHLPYKGKRLNMMLILPKQVEGFLETERKLTAERLNVWIDHSQKSKVEVFLPKFKIASEYYLSQTLSDMGMPDAFDPDLADFSGMDAAKSLYISAVIHKAVIEVNEEGTEAAAATVALMAKRSIAPPAPVFRADHPFIFLIRDVQTNAILFMGRVADLRR